MSRIRLAVGAAVLAAAIAVSAQAQAPSPSDSSPSTVDKVKTWSSKKWSATKAELSKDKTKWDGCVAAAHDQKLKLSSKAGWAYVYDCMKKS
jgi:hypothetical protein